MISAKALGAMPQFALENVGPKALDRALFEAGLPTMFIESREGYIPENALATFVYEIGRRLGQQNVGLLWAPALTVLDYDAWGGHVLSAPTLGAGLERARRIMPYHSSTDRTEFRLGESLVCYAYRFGLPGHRAYPDIAFSALGSMLSIFRHYLGANWRPVRIHLNLPQVSRATDVEATFGCPVVWNTNRLEICFRRDDLGTRPPRPVERLTTVEDLMRERGAGTPIVFTDIVKRVLRLQIRVDGVSLEKAAQSLDLGVRSLQRYLEAEGTSFRELSNRVVVDRAKELLRHGGISVVDIATELGYGTPNNFSRAFRQIVGISPTRFAESRDKMKNQAVFP